MEHAAAHNLRTVKATFHQKVEEAAAFAEKLPKTAAELYARDASGEDLAAAEKLPVSSIGAQLYELEAGRHVPPERVWAAWLRGRPPSTERREALRQFANGIDAAGAGTGRSSPAAACSAKASTSPANGESRPSASPTPAAPRSRSCRISAARRPNRDGSPKVARIIVPSSSSPAKTPPT
ncbi:hypothetical protein ACQ88U_37860 [Streptomyces lividans]